MGTMKRLQVLVDGYFEIVHTIHLVALADRSISTTPIVMLVDEDGHQNHKPVNLRASKFYGKQTDQMVGDAVLLGHYNSSDGGDLISLPEYFTVEYFQERTQLLGLR
jgi:glycerol-3-phosphate cytidylyltransferase-like family protein